ncbi:MAG: glycyl-radical enzyme activating protein [Bacteroidales bacterium]
MNQNLIFDIKRYAINDGPGIRVAVFFKGCNLRCAWCHNPESHEFGPELMYSLRRCILCGSCVDVCAHHSLKLSPNGILIDHESCTGCGDCAESCPTSALEISGKVMSNEEILAIIEKELIFLENSGGGVTFSGGEPLLHAPRLKELLIACGAKGIHRAVDTAGHVPSAVLMDIARYTDLFLFDLKMMDSDQHRQWTGVGNELILSNLKELSASGAEIIIRIPLIGGVNDTKENITASAQFIATLPEPLKKVQILVYHPVAQHKFEKMGKAEAFVRLKEPSADSILNALAIFKEYEIEAETGG